MKWCFEGLAAVGCGESVVVVRYKLKVRIDSLYYKRRQIVYYIVLEAN